MLHVVVLCPMVRNSFLAHPHLAHLTPHTPHTPPHTPHTPHTTPHTPHTTRHPHTPSCFVDVMPFYVASPCFCRVRCYVGGEGGKDGEQAGAQHPPTPLKCLFVTSSLVTHFLPNPPLGRPMWNVTPAPNARNFLSFLAFSSPMFWSFSPKLVWVDGPPPGYGSLLTFWGELLSYFLKSYCYPRGVLSTCVVGSP